MNSSVFFWILSCALNASSSEISLSFLSSLTISLASRRALRTWTLYSSQILLTTLTSSLRRCSVRGGIEIRTIFPSLEGVSPRSDLRMAFSISLITVASQGWIGDQPTFRYCQGRQLVDGGQRPVIVDLDPVQQRQGSPAGAHPFQLLLQGADHLLHVLLVFLVDVVDHGILLSGNRCSGISPAIGCGRIGVAEKRAISCRCACRRVPRRPPAGCCRAF